MAKALDAAPSDKREAVEEVPTLDAMAREGARCMLLMALEEGAQDIEARGTRRAGVWFTPNGRAQARSVICGAGTMEVRATQIHDRQVDDESECQWCTRRILPSYIRQLPQVAEVLPMLYLRACRRGPPARGCRNGRVVSCYPEGESRSPSRAERPRVLLGPSWLAEEIERED